METRALVVALVALQLAALRRLIPQFKAPDNFAVDAVAPAESVTSLPPGCNCTDVGISGNVDVDGRIGCRQWLQQSTGDPTWACYVKDPSTCPSALPSSAFPGAYYRVCNPDVDVTLEEASGANRTLEDIIKNVPDLSIFAAALDQVGLLDALGSSGDLSGVTLFAPSDAAFQDMFAVLNITEADLADWDKLVALLLFHIGIGEYTKADLAGQAFTEIPTAAPAAFSTLLARTTRRVVYQPGMPRQAFQLLELDAPVYDPSSATGSSEGTFGYRQFIASNGVLHVINGVMGPPQTATEFLADTPSFSTFVQAMNITGVLDLIGSDCPNATTGDCDFNPITIWAPTNTAFQRLAAAQNVTVADLLDLPLEDIVLGHITDPDAVTSPIIVSELSGNDTIPTLYGSNVTVAINTTFVRAGVDPLLGPLFVQRQELVLQSANPQAAGIGSAQGFKVYNGIVYPITRVLLPYPVAEGEVAQQAGAQTQAAAAPTAESGQAGNGY
ncbi:hypothetical protein N2152v2_005378 [Parachlorella kessleri]